MRNSKNDEKVVHPTPIKRLANISQKDRNVLWWLLEGDHLAFLPREVREDLLKLNSSTEPLGLAERRFLYSTIRSSGLEPEQVWDGANHGTDQDMKPLRRYPVLP